MKLEIFNTDSREKLKGKVNAWLDENKHINVIDVKFQIKHIPKTAFVDGETVYIYTILYMNKYGRE